MGVYGRGHNVGSDQSDGSYRSRGHGKENVSEGKSEDDMCDVVQVSVSAGGSRGHAVLVSVSADGGRGHVVRSNAIYQIARTRVDEYRSVSKMKMKDEREPVVVQES